MIENILGIPTKVAESANAAESRRLNDVLMAILPVNRRCSGLMNDAIVVAQLKPADLCRIEAPTLLISTQDDLYGTFRAARYLAQEIPNARLVIYPDGGHLWIGHGEELQREVEAFLRPFGASQYELRAGGGRLQTCRASASGRNRAGGVGDPHSEPRPLGSGS